MVAQGPRTSGFSIRRLLEPFRKHYYQFLAGTIVRQALLVVGGYSMVWALRIVTGASTFPIYLLVLALVLFDGAYIGLDTALNALFARRLSFPFFGHLRSTALKQ